MINFNRKATDLLKSELQSWETARKNYAALPKSETRRFDFENFSVFVQHNSARINSTAAKVTQQDIQQRACFLCAKNRPENQHFILAGNYHILLNPFPIFPQHFTIVYTRHTTQIIDGYFFDFLYFTQILSDFVVFFNAADYGASAPDHLHFQAGTKNFLPLVNDYKNLKNSADSIKKHDCFEIFSVKNYLRRVFCIEAENRNSAMQAFDFLTDTHIDKTKINLVAHYENGKFYVFVFPRKAFRPAQYFSEKQTDRLLISPAAVEMSGVLIAPVKQDFEKITHTDIENIYSQISE